jgi:hypothetical protein
VDEGEHPAADEDHGGERCRRQYPRIPLALGFLACPLGLHQAFKW